MEMKIPHIEQRILQLISWTVSKVEDKIHLHFPSFRSHVQICHSFTDFAILEKLYRVHMFDLILVKYRCVIRGKCYLFTCGDEVCFSVVFIQHIGQQVSSMQSPESVEYSITHVTQHIDIDELCSCAYYLYIQ